MTKKKHTSVAHIGAILLILVAFFILFEDNNREPLESNNIEKSLTEEVIQYKPLVNKYLKEHNKEKYTAVVLSLMMQESSGRGNDPMQASESYCGEVGCIEDPEVSIKQGVAYFSKVLEQANGDVKLALQSYNFGIGFISYVQDNGGQYTEELAIQFSQKKYEELKHTGIYSCIRKEAEPYNACYGDFMYVQAVLDYYSDALSRLDKSTQVALVNE
ncbi:lysozyme family protein [Aquibacillus koreensis]|uniref:Lysozyme family protein n=1 Tax=Aquibacillus koreensis TaxID=279446 RepID=A0A9X4AL61_9BACI|nr:lysozyme family protein [Aquibacillus koreensis]MCT2536171.1 lysozyme family protein [Aquibacillus koreensis]MDC3422095.1 lysozyme family protein [Aquibacillus koreensis]